MQLFGTQLLYPAHSTTVCLRLMELEQRGQTSGLIGTFMSFLDLYIFKTNTKPNNSERAWVVTKLGSEPTNLKRKKAVCNRQLKLMTL